MPELIAEGPPKYLGGSIMTFALPMGLFILVALVLFFIYRRPHRLPNLRYLTPAQVAAVATPEVGRAPRADTTSEAASSLVQERLAKSARTEADAVGEMTAADASSGAAGPVSDTAIIEGADVAAEEPGPGRPEGTGGPAGPATGGSASEGTE